MGAEAFIKEKAKELGGDVCGIGNIERFHDAPQGFSPLDYYPGCRSIVAVGIALPKGIFEVPPRLIYGYFNMEVKDQLDLLLLKLAKAMEEELGCKAVPLPSDSPNEYWDAENKTAKGIISMKHTAVRCGLGSIGKSSLLLNEQYGNRLTVGCILTDMVLEPDPISREICLPNCHNCEENCPAHAIANGRVNQKLCRENTYHQTARGFSTTDCNNCRKVCPMRDGKR